MVDRFLSAIRISYTFANIFSLRLLNKRTGVVLCIIILRNMIFLFAKFLDFENLSIYV